MNRIAIYLLTLFNDITMQHLRNFWAFIISNLIWFAEKVTFYPKLRLAYKTLYKCQVNGKIEGEFIVFDVGSNKGQSINFFRDLFPRVKIYAFEPSKKTFTKLERRIKKRRQKNVFLFQFGLGEFPGEFDFYESILDETSTFALPKEDSRYLNMKNKILFQKNKEGYKKTLCRIETLDNFIQEYEINHIDILKIDVEGFEYEVLRGGNIALQEKKINIVQFERHTDDMREDNFVAINDFLKVRGYLRVTAIQHLSGNFFEMLYQRT
jgi:FkbM family methyltransferase